jgi:hypothetical protein
MQSYSMWIGFRNNKSKMTEVHISEAVEMDNIRANLPESGDAKIVPFATSDRS